MSIVDSRHNIVAFDSKSSKPFESQRLAKCIFKTQKDGTKVSDSVCASVPFLSESDIVDNAASLVPHIKSMLESAQNEIIRALHLTGAASVADNEIDISSCIKYLDSQNESARLTVESINYWFKSNVEDALYVRFAGKLFGADIESLSDSQELKVQQSINAYRGKLAALSGGATLYPPAIADKLVELLQTLCDDSDSVATRLIKRLQGMKVAESDLLESI